MELAYKELGDKEQAQQLELEHKELGHKLELGHRQALQST
jgi:hypothetical protein